MKLKKEGTIDPIKMKEVVYWRIFKKKK